MATSESEDKDAPRNNEQERIKKEQERIKKEQERIKKAIAANIWVKWLLAFFILVCGLVILWWFYEEPPADKVHYNPIWIVVLPFWIVTTSLWSLRYVKPSIPEGSLPFPTGFKMRGTPGDFPWSLLAFDFLNLALLVALTGGFQSIFLPLFVVALLLGEVSFTHKDRDKRNLVRGVFAVFVLSSVLLPEIPPIRYLFVNLCDSTDAQSVWILPAFPHWPRGFTVILSLAVFLVGAIFGSLVVDWYKGQVEGETQPKEG